MHKTNLRKVGGSVMLAVPPPILETLELGAGSTVGMKIDSGRLIVEPAKRRYTLDELLAQCDPDAPLPDDGLDWTNSPAAGSEAI
jgi:antitoxin ChpS